MSQAGWSLFVEFKSVNVLFRCVATNVCKLQVQAFFAAHDIWYCQVRQAQRVRHHYKQAKAGGSFLQTLGVSDCVLC